MQFVNHIPLQPVHDICSNSMVARHVWGKALLFCIIFPCSFLHSLSPKIRWEVDFISIPHIAAAASLLGELISLLHDGRGLTRMRTGRNSNITGERRESEREKERERKRECHIFNCCLGSLISTGCEHPILWVLELWATHRDCTMCWILVTNLGHLCREQDC